MTMRRGGVGLSVKLTVDESGCSPMVFVDIAGHGGEFTISVGECVVERGGPRRGEIGAEDGILNRVGNMLCHVCAEGCNASGTLSGGFSQSGGGEDGVLWDRRPCDREIVTR